MQVRSRGVGCGGLARAAQCRDRSGLEGTRPQRQPVAPQQAREGCDSIVDVKSLLNPLCERSSAPASRRVSDALGRLEECRGDLTDLLGSQAGHAPARDVRATDDPLPG